MPLDIVHPGWPEITSSVFFMVKKEKWQADIQRAPGVWSCSRPIGRGRDRETRDFTEAQINPARVRKPEAVAVYEWLKDKNVGDIVHHTPYGPVRDADRKQPFVRCRIDVEDGAAYLLPLALVGGWGAETLPRFDNTGRFDKGRGIIADIVWRRRFPFNTKHGVYGVFNNLDGYYETAPIGDPAHGHPKDWEPISLEPLDFRDRELIRLKAIGAKIDAVLPRRMVQGPSLLPFPFFGFDRRLPDDEEQDFGLGTSNYREELRRTLLKMRDILNAADLEEPVKKDEGEKVAE